MNLYHVTEIYPQGITLLQAEVVSETEKTYTLKGDEASRWMQRVNKSELAYKGFHLSAEDAWNAYLSNAESQVSIAERRLENAQEYLRKVKDAMANRKELANA